MWLLLLVRVQIMQLLLRLLLLVRVQIMQLLLRLLFLPLVLPLVLPLRTVALPKPGPPKRPNTTFCATPLQQAPPLRQPHRRCHCYGLQTTTSPQPRCPCSAN